MEKLKDLKVLVVATMDTKGEEAMYLVSCLEKMGITPLIMDAGIRGNPKWPVYKTRHQVAEKGGTTLAEVQAIPHEGKALDAMITGAVKTAREIAEEGGIKGVIALGGSMGTTLGTSVMRALPFGFPKVMISTMASRNTRAFVGTKDILMLHSVCDLAGLNRMTRKVLLNGAGALGGMVWGKTEKEFGFDYKKPQVALSTLGTTEACADYVRRTLSDAGYEVVTFHTNGSGGQAMDEMIKEGSFDGVIDLSLHEIADHVYGGDYDAGPERGVFSLRRGIPTVYAPGNMDFFVTGPLSEAQRRFPGRLYHSHNEAITVAKPTPEEMAALGRLLAERTREARGPLRVLIPEEGFSAFGHREGPFYEPLNPARFIKAFEETTCEKSIVRRVPAHINDYDFSKAIVQAFVSMMRN